MSTANKYPLPTLKQIMRDNNIRGVKTMNKPEILKLLDERGLLPAEGLTKPQKIVKEINPKYEYLKSILHNPRKVLVKDIESGVMRVSFNLQG